MLSLDLRKASDDENSAAFLLSKQLFDLDQYLFSFRAAVALNVTYSVESQKFIESLSVEKMDDDAHLRRRFLDEFTAIAARDSALSVYHYGTILTDGLSLEHLPNMRQSIDSNKLKLARKTFLANFPDWKKARHAIAHESELHLDSECNERNSFSNQNIKTPGIYIDDSCTNIVVQGNQLHGKYVSGIRTTHDSSARIVKADCSRAALVKLMRVHRLVSEAFEAVLMK